MRIIISAIIVFILTTSAKAGDLMIESSSYKNNDRIPILYTCDGKNIPPSLSWKNPPPNTQSFALILSNPDSPTGNTFYSWVVYNIPSEINKLPENKDLPDGTLVGNNSVGDAIYRGPCPPDAHIHHYVFTVYALDRRLILPSEAELDEVLPEINRHTIAKAEIVGTYNH
jgi:Raf kinase inhibitor-like YbhB/YbcL family protein